VDLLVKLPVFVTAVVLISASPGPAMALIVRRAALRGLRGSVPVVLGLEAGLYVWALLAAAGVAGLVAASQTAFVVVRAVGAVVLVYLGVRAWRAAWQQRRADTDQTSDLDAADLDAADPRVGDPQAGDAADEAAATARRGTWWAFGEGAMVQLANPKAAVFMIAFYPQFVPPERPLFTTTALLALLQVAIEIVLYLTLAATVSRAGAWFRRPVVRRRLEAVSGTVLVGLGLRLAVSER
jgi:threonine/homoserine/homoserine lactone efflux protein